MYASLGVGEYWLFDPTGDYLAPRLQGFSLHAGEYRPLASVTPVSGGLSLHSEALGLDVGIDEDGRLRIHDPVSGKNLLAHDEEAAARRADGHGVTHKAPHPGVEGPRRTRPQNSRFRGFAWD